MINKVKSNDKTSYKRIRKLSRMCVLCYQNCVRLHNDSILLFNNKRYPTAHAISIIALEEMGKYLILSHGLFYGFFDDESDEKFINEILNDAYDHRSKQRVFVNNEWNDNFYNDIKLLDRKGIDWGKIREEMGANFEEKLKDDRYGELFPNTKKLYEKMETLEKEKHRSLYVGFPKTGKKADLSKRISSPFRFSKKKVEDQITYVNDRLLFDALRVLKGFSSLEFRELDDMITPRYVVNLHKIWPLITKKNRSELLSLMKLPNDKEDYL